MKLLVLGNINAGKSTYIKKIFSKLPDYKYIAIDEYRIQYSDEEKARRNFIKDILKTPNCIVEFTGFGDIAKNLQNKLPINSCLIIYIDTPKNICINRINEKIDYFKQIPYPETIDKLENTINKLDIYLQQNKLYENWKNVAINIYSIYYYDTSNSTDNIPFLHYHYLFELINLFRTNKFKKLISFGSLGRQQLTIHSDIDLILITNKSISYIKELIEKFYKTSALINILDNKLIINIKNNNITIELYIVKNFVQNIKYYHGSQIKNIEKTIMLGNNDIIEDISTALSIYQNTEYNYNNIIIKVENYIKIYKKMFNQGDIFGCYFYHSLIIFEYMRILCIKENIVEYLYCPKNIDNSTNNIIKKYKLDEIMSFKYDKNYIKKVISYYNTLKII